jgi:hypothetical protein
MGTTMNTQREEPMDTHCGVTEFGEEGLCARHLAEMEEVSLGRVERLRSVGRLEAHRASTRSHPGRNLDCGVRHRGRCLTPVGAVLEAENEGVFA